MRPLDPRLLPLLRPASRALVGLVAAQVALTLAITWWAAKRTRSTREFYAAGRSVSAFQNGLALAGGEELTAEARPMSAWSAPSIT